jgi:hypothetical protein
MVSKKTNPPIFQLNTQQDDWRELSSKALFRPLGHIDRGNPFQFNSNAF